MVKPPPEILTREEMDKLLEAAMVDPYWYMLFLIAKKTGKRLGELYHVKVKDINYDLKIMITRVLKKRKRVDKETILPEEVIVHLKQHIKQSKLGSGDYVFRKTSYRTIQRKVKEYGKKAGIKKNLMFHNFRHYFITELVKQGWSWDKIIKLTGHSNVMGLASYDHATARDIEKDAREAIKKI